MQGVQRPSDSVCAACHCGIHHLARCTVGHCINNEYFAGTPEIFSVCLDCMWKWVQFLSSDPSRELPYHQAAALATMSANVVSFSSIHNHVKNCIKHFLRCNSASDISLIHALQRHRSFRHPSLSVAKQKVDELIKCGHIVVLGGMCRWNDEPFVPVQNAIPVHASSVTTSRKRFLSV